MYQGGSVQTGESLAACSIGACTVVSRYDTVNDSVNGDSIGQELLSHVQVIEPSASIGRGGILI